MKRIIVVGVALSAAVTLAACGPKAKVTAAPAASASAAASGVPAGAAPSSDAPAPAPSASASASVSPSRQNQAPPSAGPGGGSPGFTAALAEWKKGAKASSADEGIYWTRAAADLESGKKTDKGRTDEYSFAIAALKALVKLPSGQQSSGQNMQFHIDVNALNSFFGTPGLYS